MVWNNGAEPEKYKSFETRKDFVVALKNGLRPEDIGNRELDLIVNQGWNANPQKRPSADTMAANLEIFYNQFFN